ncbi:BnaC09g15290D [Brassica napus]|uniref:BnaC09g15290D protein n=1 Tax=Brassica napus TaxID=3708 RepID=A0A078HZB9_BRANA|nr:BnaC09g15290D [Brassica napus]
MRQLIKRRKKLIYHIEDVRLTQWSKLQMFHLTKRDRHLWRKTSLNATPLSSANMQLSTTAKIQANQIRYTSLHYPNTHPPSTTPLRTPLPFTNPLNTHPPSTTPLRTPLSTPLSFTNPLNTHPPSTTPLRTPLPSTDPLNTHTPSPTLHNTHLPFPFWHTSLVVHSRVLPCHLSFFIYDTADHPNSPPPPPLHHLLNQEPSSLNNPRYDTSSRKDPQQQLNPITPETSPTKSSGFPEHADSVNAFAATATSKRTSAPILNFDQRQEDCVDVSDSSPARPTPWHQPSDEECHLAVELRKCPSISALALLVPLPHTQWELFKSTLKSNIQVFHITLSKFDFSNKFILEIAEPQNGSPHFIWKFSCTCSLEGTKKCFIERLLLPLEERN